MNKILIRNYLTKNLNINGKNLNLQGISHYHKENKNLADELTSNKSKIFFEIDQIRLENLKNQSNEKEEQDYNYLEKVKKQQISFNSFDSLLNQNQSNLTKGNPLSLILLYHLRNNLCESNQIDLTYNFVFPDKDTFNQFENSISNLLSKIPNEIIGIDQRIEVTELKFKSINNLSTFNHIIDKCNDSSIVEQFSDQLNLDQLKFIDNFDKFMDQMNSIDIKHLNKLLQTISEELQQCYGFERDIIMSTNIMNEMDNLESDQANAVIGKGHLENVQNNLLYLSNKSE